MLRLRLAILAVLWGCWIGSARTLADEGVPPVGEDGRPLNVDFEDGTLRDWIAEGDAFQGMPIRGDVVHARRADMASDHQGEFWVGSFEPTKSDRPLGTLTSVPFALTKPFLSFRVGGGSHPGTRVEIVEREGETVRFTASGTDSENMTVRTFEVGDLLGKTVFVRIVDEDSAPWGHINFDDLRLHDSPPHPPAVSQPGGPDEYKFSGLAAEAAARMMTAPDGFSVRLFAGEPDVMQPIAMAIDDRGRIWIVEGFTYPRRAPEGQGKDRILIFEDTDGDGHFDVRKVFQENLNLVSGIEVGFGGVWVGAAPYFLFIPDKNGDDVPDGEPEVLLDGWGYEDTHETLNSFIWGPDGWLYGCHGVFTHSRVGKPGTPDNERTPLNAGIWRYHPVKNEFEVFAHGTSNPWGVDFNNHGQCFLTCCVIPHLFHVIQDARYLRQGGVHFNPYTFDDIQTIAKHRHYVGANPHGGNNRSDSAGGGHAHAGAMIYLGGAWPAKYFDQILMNNIHGQRINMDALSASGSGYTGDRAPDFLFSNDRWSQILNLQYGPDGQVYMIDWYDLNACHHGNPEGHDRSNGRIFKVVYGDQSPMAVDLQNASNEDLVAYQLHQNDWWVRHSRRILQERAAAGMLSRGARLQLADLAISQSDEARRLRGLWALHVTGGVPADVLLKSLDDASPYVRGWAVQLALEGHTSDLAPEIMAKLVELSANDSSQVVRLYLATAAQRLPGEARWELLSRLVEHAEDGADHNLPLMYWYALEPLAAEDPRRALELAASSPIPRLLEFTARRIAAGGVPNGIELALNILDSASEDGHGVAILQGLRAGLAGRRRVPTPQNWATVSANLRRSTSPELQREFEQLAVIFGDKAALERMRTVLGDSNAPAAERGSALETLLRAGDQGLGPILLRLVDDADLRDAAIQGLAAYEQPGAAEALIKIYPSLRSGQKRDVLATLSARASYAQEMLAAVARKELPASDLPADLVRQMKSFQDERISSLIDEVWGSVREASVDKEEMIEAYRWMLGARPDYTPDPSLGRAVFAKTCQQCHTLFGTGGKVGPELTGSNRADRNYILTNILDPSAVMAREYMPSVVVTADGRLINGIIKSQSANALSIQTPDEVITLPASEVDEIRPSDTSMMPDDLLKPLSDEQVRSLIAYLASSQQVPMLATPDNQADFFNGKDLSGWRGAESLWSVEDGELVGRTAGLDHNEFIVSEYTANNFRLEFQVKLVDNEGNSGVQFRSEPLPDGEVRGYQADIGAGWWGKLYEELGRALLWDKSGEEHVKPGEWNDYVIEANGDHIHTYINGKLCVDLDDPGGAKQGVFALQLHSGGPTEVRYRNFKLTVLEAN